MSGGNKTKKLKPTVIISVAFSIRNARNYFYAESLMHSRYNYKNIRSLVDSERVCRCRQVQIEEFTLQDD